MLDFGWQEFLVVAIVTVLVVGPKELPRVFRTITGFMRKLRSLAGEFHSAMDEMARDAELDDVKSQFDKIRHGGTTDWVKEIDPTGEVDQSMKDLKSEVEKTRKEVNRAGRPTAGATGPLPGTAGGLKMEKPSEKQEDKATETPVLNKTAVKKATVKKAATKTAAKKSATKKAATKMTAKKSAAKKGTAKTDGGKSAAGAKA